MQPELTESPLLTPAQVAEALHVSPRTLLRYGVEGRLEVVKLTKRTLRYPAASVRALIAGASSTEAEK